MANDDVTPPVTVQGGTRTGVFWLGAEIVTVPDWYGPPMGLPREWGFLAAADECPPTWRPEYLGIDRRASVLAYSHQRTGDDVV